MLMSEAAEQRAKQVETTDGDSDQEEEDARAERDDDDVPRPENVDETVLDDLRVPADILELVRNDDLELTIWSQHEVRGCRDELHLLQCAVDDAPTVLRSGRLPKLLAWVERDVAAASQQSQEVEGSFNDLDNTIDNRTSLDPQRAAAEQRHRLNVVAPLRQELQRDTDMSSRYQQTMRMHTLTLTFVSGQPSLRQRW